MRRSTVDPGTQDEENAPTEDVPSPCVGICRLNPEQVCVGCGRTLDEITEWPASGNERRRQIRRRAAQRLAPQGVGEKESGMTAVSPEQFAFTLPLAVRWGDMDALGHVNNAKFFTYDESARLEYFGRLLRDDPRFWKDYGLILAHIEADFLDQLRCPATLNVGFRVSRLGSKSLRTVAGMFHEGRPVAVTQAVIVWFDYRSSRTLPVPDSVRSSIRDLERVPPEEG